ncbi:MAG: rod shape-determining protein MreD [Candidatus Omnitrophota bacterium]
MSAIRIILNKLRNYRFRWVILRFRRKLQKYRSQEEALSALFVIMLLDATLFNYLRIFDARPDVVLAALIILSVFFTLKWSVGFALLAGIFRDSMSTLPFGFNTVICVLLVILAKWVSQKLKVENSFIRSAVLFLTILLNNIALGFILFVLGNAIAASIFLRVAVTQSVITLLLALPMYRFFTPLENPRSLTGLTGDASRIIPAARR